MTKTTAAQLEVLSHHYSETFELLKSDVAKRDRLFLYLLIMIFILLFYMTAPTAVIDWLNAFITNQAGNLGKIPVPNLIDISFINVALSLCLLSLAHTYFQTVLHVERQYGYVYELEKQLSQHFDELAFIREGKFYRSRRHLFSRWTTVIFWGLFPSLFLLFNVIWLIFLLRIPGAPVGYKIIESLISVCILISLVLYFWALRKKN